MTNFEKWKAELTPEQILEIIKDEMTPHDMWVLWVHKYYLKEENFLEWANTEAEETKC